MPLATDPNRTFKVSLSSDMETPAETRPVFVYRYSTGRQWREACEFSRQIKDAKSDTEMPFDNIDQLFDRLREKLIGWENMTDPDTGEVFAFDGGRLEDILNLSEAFELLQLKLTQSPTDDDKKKLESPSD